MSHFIVKLAPRTNQQVTRIADDALGRLMSYHWPGNVRELENVIEQSLVFAETDQITLSALPEFLRGGAEEGSPALPRWATLAHAAGVKQLQIPWAPRSTNALTARPTRSISGSLGSRPSKVSTYPRSRTQAKLGWKLRS